MESKIDFDKIQKEAKVYCFSAAAAINVKRAKESEFQSQLNLMIENSKNMQEMLAFTYDDIVFFTARYVKDNLEKQGLEVYDLNNVGWEMGVNCYVWSNSLPSCKGNFTGIFTATWDKYFSIHDLISSKAIFLKESDIANIIQSPGFGFKLDLDDRNEYNYNFSRLEDQRNYDLEHPLRLFWVFTSHHRVTNFSNQNTSSIQSWYLTQNNHIEKGFLTKTVYAAFAPHYVIHEIKEEPLIYIRLDILKKFMIGMQREFPNKFSKEKLKRIIGLNF